MPENEEDRVLSIEEVLAEEADKIAGDGSNIAGILKEQLGAKEARKLRFDRDFHRSADERDDTKVDPKTIAVRKQLYQRLNELKRGALCFSGGGIRSATFCLGILQALARCKEIPPPPPPAPPPKHGEHHAAGKNEKPHHAEPNEQAHKESKKLPQSLLGAIHYLSTVSGGGYIGSWLSAWRTRARFSDIIADLTTRPSGPDFEPPQISWLRAYSSYLSPRLGIGSADSWAAVAIVVRNLVLNWFVIIPVVAFGVLLLKLIATISVWTAENVVNPDVMIPLAGVGAVLLVLAQAFTIYHRPALQRQPEETDPVAAPPRRIKCWLCRHKVDHEKYVFCRRINTNDTCFVLGDLIWAALSAIVLTVFFTSQYFWMSVDNLSQHLTGAGCVPAIIKGLGLTRKIGVPVLTAGGGLVIYTIGWIAGWPQVLAGRDWLQWALSGLIYGALVGFGAWLFSLLIPYPPHHLPLLVGIIFGVPWIIMSQLTADNLFGGFVSYEPHSDSDREWLGRAAGWLSAFAVAWGIVAFLVFAGEYAVQRLLDASHHYVVASGGVVSVLSGIATAFFGGSAKTPAKSKNSGQTDYTELAYSIGLAIAGPIFAAALIVALSAALDKLLLGASLVTLLATAPASATPLWHTAGWLLLGLVVAYAIGHTASRCVNINRFSLHALYRNRLIRAYLGASRDERHPNRFTGFDGKDNVRVHELWPDAINPRRLFHVVNIALNVVSTKRLAWQERKAEPFTVTALHSGGAYVGFRGSKDYGDSIHTAHGQGIALGTAMAISGAAASPNMGYISSPSLAILLTLFNVRLGWWLGNPGPAGNDDRAYRREGPKLAARPLFDEALGRTTDDNPYVYLSDGGHFENLGLYEMVRRRCRLIIVVDAGCDPKFSFEDLGNAVRKIYIDLGVRVTFDTLGDLSNRPTEKQLRSLTGPDGDARRKTTQDEARRTIPYYAVGTIHYKAADGDPCEDGKVIYIKPAYHGTEGAAVRSYATANPTFPHETTLDQFFTESQFESYRALGLDIGAVVLAAPDVQRVLYELLR